MHVIFLLACVVHASQCTVLNRSPVLGAAAARIGSSRLRFFRRILNPLDYRSSAGRMRSPLDARPAVRLRQPALGVAPEVKSCLVSCSASQLQIDVPHSARQALSSQQARRRRHRGGGQPAGRRPCASSARLRSEVAEPGQCGAAELTTRAGKMGPPAMLAAAHALLAELKGAGCGGHHSSARGLSAAFGLGMLAVGPSCVAAREHVGPSCVAESSHAHICRSFARMSFLCTSNS